MTDHATMMAHDETEIPTELLPFKLMEGMTWTEAYHIDWKGTDACAYMEVEAYHSALAHMNEEGDTVLDYLEQSGAYEEGLPPVPGRTSWAGIAVHYLRHAVGLACGTLVAQYTEADVHLAQPDGVNPGALCDGDAVRNTPDPNEVTCEECRDLYVDADLIDADTIRAGLRAGETLAEETDGEVEVHFGWSPASDRVTWQTGDLQFMGPVYGMLATVSVTYTGDRDLETIGQQVALDLSEAAYEALWG